VKGSAHLVEIATDLPEDKQIPVLIQRNGQTQFLALKIES
jgi:hypothetical protein